MSYFSPIDGKLITHDAITCCWTDCERKASNAYWEMELDHEKEANVWLFFCSEGHLVLHQTSPRDFGNVPTGSKSLLRP